MGLKLIGEVALDGSGFESGLKKLERGAERVGETLKGLALAAVGVYGIENAIHKTVETAEKLVDTSRRLGVGLEALQEFGLAAKQNGADIDALTGFIEKLNSTRIDPKKFESFAKLGISQPDLSSLKVEDLIMKLSLNLRNRSAQEVIGPLRDIGGRGAGQLLPMLKEDLEEVREEARKLGVVMRSEDAVMLKFLADEMAILAQLIVANVAPAIVFLEEKFLRFVNVIKAIGTFAGSLVGGKAGGGIAAIWDELTSPQLLNKRTPAQMKEVFKNIKEGLSDSMDAFSLEYAEGDKRVDETMAELLRKQKEIEKINSIPSFEDVMGHEKRQKGSGKQVNSDSLLRVGNFLGSVNNPMISIAHTQTILLREIAQHTRPKATGGREPGSSSWFSFFPHH
jgi:hypothetical protein